MATAFKIEKGIPLAPKQRGGNRSSIYPFKEMAVGDSFLAGPYSRVLQARVGSSASYQRQTYGTRFSVRRDGGNIRVWRVA